MEDYLEDYNQMTNTPMSLVLFESAVEHIARISRIINQPYGNALLVGVGGSGRKSLTTMAVHIAEFTRFTIEITKSYGLPDWREDIKTMMNKAGVQNKPTVFMIDDTQIVRESFLEDINGILNTGEVANLFNSEETGKYLIFISRHRSVCKISRQSFHFFQFISLLVTSDLFLHFIHLPIFIFLFFKLFFPLIISQVL